MNLRDLFPYKVDLRLDEASQRDMVLGEGARKWVAEACLIDLALPRAAYARIEGSSSPVRVASRLRLR